MECENCHGSGCILCNEGEKPLSPERIEQIRKEARTAAVKIDSALSGINSVLRKKRPHLTLIQGGKKD